MSAKKIISSSPQFREGSFRNFSLTPMLAPDASYFTVIINSLRRPRNVKPSAAIASVKTNLLNLHTHEPAIVWFGHSSYLISTDEINILVDPVFSGHASPLPFLVKAFPGSDVYHPEDMPPIDLLIITHNHYDHLDARTLSLLAPGIKKCIAPLGVSGTLVKCGIPKDKILEMDWWQEQEFEEIGIVAIPARHFSGRGLKRGGSLWCSFAVTVAGHKIFVGGDSGYDSHFAETGKRFGFFDLAILECGQYSRYWPFIHMMPEETVQAAIDLNAKCLLPVHWGKFALANHPWTEPVEKLLINAAEKGIKVTTPRIGETVILDKKYPSSHWWKD